MNRRALLQASAIGLSTLLAGCAGDGATGDLDPGGTTDEQDGTTDEPDGGATTGETDDETTNGTEQSDVGDVEEMATVTIPGREFSPDLVRVTVGGTVRWTFEDDGHTVTAYEDRIPAGAEAFDSGFGNEGDTFEVTLEAEGVYDYYCVPHASAGMVGSVIVGDPDPEGDEPGLADPAQDGDEGAALESLNARAREALSDEGDFETVDAETLTDADGEIDIEVRTQDGTVRAGEPADIVARFEGRRLTNAPVEVEGDFQGNTDAEGAFQIIVPQDLEPGDECRIEIRVDGARGRIEVPVDG